MKHNLQREQVDHYKNKLNESVWRSLGRGVGRVKNALKGLWNVPGVKPATRTALTAGAVAGGMYAYDRYVKPTTPTTPTIDPQQRSNTPSQQRQKGIRANVEDKPKRRSSGFTSTAIVPVERRGGEATQRYGEMLRSPGGVAGAMRRQRAEEIWKQWQEEDAAKTPTQPAPVATPKTVAPIDPEMATMQAAARETDPEKRANLIRSTKGYTTEVENIKKSQKQTPNTPKANQPMDLGAGARFQQQAQKEAGELESRRKKIASDFKMSMQSGPKANKPMDLNQ